MVFDEFFHFVLEGYWKAGCHRGLKSTAALADVQFFLDAAFMLFR